MNKIIWIICFLLPQLVPAIVSADDDFDLEQFKGKVVYVDFWASWCIPCRASFPFMQNMAEKYGDSLVITAINVDRKRSDADQFLEQFNVNFDIIYDPQGSLAESFDVKGMPTSYLYDRDGHLVGTHIGFKQKDIDKLEAAIVNVIGGQF